MNLFHGLFKKLFDTIVINQLQRSDINLIIDWYSNITPGRKSRSFKHNCNKK